MSLKSIRKDANW